MSQILRIWISRFVGKILVKSDTWLKSENTYYCSITKILKKSSLDLHGRSDNLRFFKLNWIIEILFDFIRIFLTYLEKIIYYFCIIIYFLKIIQDWTWKESECQCISHLESLNYEFHKNNLFKIFFKMGLLLNLMGRYLK